MGSNNFKRGGAIAKKCRKKAYNSEREADCALNYICPSYNDWTFTSYKCQSCGLWHVGHKNPEDKILAKLRLGGVKYLK